MTVDRYLRMIAGFFILISLALGYWASPYWFLFTAFVGLNLFPPAFRNWSSDDGDPAQAGRNWIMACGGTMKRESRQ